MPNQNFRPEHMNATHEDFIGNNGIGRYVILPGSDGRAKEISTYFDNVTYKLHARAHNLYLGTLQHEGQTIDVATISSGMGCPSMEIITHELFQLGVKRFLRVGTAGSMQTNRVRTGHLVNAQASVSDEDTTTSYAPKEVPAVASLEMINAIIAAAKRIGLADDLHTGVVECKSSLYAREFGAGPRAAENLAYMERLTKLGVLASEMETAALFILAQIYNQDMCQLGQGPQFRVYAGAILAIINDSTAFEHTNKVDLAINNGILLALETVKFLAIQEING